MMLRWLLFILAIPLLLAPVRVQQGSEVLLLQPSTAPTGARGTVAVALPSPTMMGPTVMGPTVIEVSPTRLPLVSLTLPLLENGVGAAARTTPSTSKQTTPPVPPIQPQPAPPIVVPASRMSPQQAAICVRALNMVSDLSSLSMKQSGRENLVELSIAAAIAQVQAAQGQWPSMEGLRGRVPLFTPNRAELKQALNYSNDFCRNPNATTRRAEGGRPR